MGARNSPILKAEESGPSSGVKDDQMQRGRTDAKPNNRQGPGGAVFPVGIEGYIQISGYAPEELLGAAQHEHGGLESIFKPSASYVTHDDEFSLKADGGSVVSGQWSVVSSQYFTRSWGMNPTPAHAKIGRVHAVSGSGREASTINDSPQSYFF